LVEEKLETLIEKTRPQFQDKNIIAFLGEVKSGKTVVSALLYYHLRKDWIPKTKGKWDAVPSSGDDEINKILRKLKRGIFTSPTPENEFPKLVIDVYNMEGKPAKTELALHDMSGENYADLLSYEYEDEEDRLIDILSGDGSYLAYAKKYVIMIDCAENNFWDTDVCKVLRMIGSLRKIKQQIHNFDDDEQLHTPISIVFTKADRLSLVDSKKSANELVDEYSGLRSSLNINHDQNSLEFFKVSIASKLETLKQAKERVKNTEEELQKHFESKTKTLKQQIDTAVSQTVSAAKKQAEAEGQPSEQIKTIVENTKNQTLKKYKNQLEEEPPQLKNKEKELQPTWKVDESFKYTESEYSKLISWILDINHDK